MPELIWWIILIYYRDPAAVVALASCASDALAFEWSPSRGRPRRRSKRRGGSRRARQAARRRPGNRNDGPPSVARSNDCGADPAWEGDRRGSDCWATWQPSRVS